MTVLLLALGATAAGPPMVLLQVEGHGDADGDSWFVHPFEVEQAGTALRVTLDWTDPDASLYVFLRRPDTPGNVSNDRTNARPKVLEHTADVAGTWEVAIKVKGQVWLTGHFGAIRPPRTDVGDPGSLPRGGLAVLDAREPTST